MRGEPSEVLGFELQERLSLVWLGLSGVLFAEALLIPLPYGWTWLAAAMLAQWAATEEIDS